MKGLPCPCPTLPGFWQLGSLFMAESSPTQALGKGPLPSVQHLRAQYEGLRRQQRAQAHLVVLPKGGNTSVPTESMVSAVWINKERNDSLPLVEADPGAQEMPEEACRDCLQTPESPWHTHLEMHLLVQNFGQKTSHREKHKGQFKGAEQRFSWGEDPGLSESNQLIEQGTRIPEAAQHECQVDNTKAVGSSLNTGIRCLPSIKNPHSSGKSAHYPFPQRKTPRISQVARNLGLYGPV